MSSDSTSRTAGVAPDAPHTPASDAQDPAHVRLRRFLRAALLEPDTVAYRQAARVQLTLVMVSIALIALESAEIVPEHYHLVLEALEWVVALAFTAEYVLTAFTVPSPRAYVLGWYGLIDLAAIVPFYLGMFQVGAGAAGTVAMLRQLRLLRVLRTLKLLKVAKASTHHPDDLWLPVSIFVTLTATGWIVDGALRRSVPAEWSELARQVSWELFAAGAWFSGAYLFNRVAALLVWGRLVPRLTGVAVPVLLRDSAAVVVYAGAFIGVLSSVLRLPLTGVWASAGAFSVVVGLALRNIILDLFVGFALSIDRSFKIGDYVTIQQNNLFGKVVEITWRTTHILTNDDNLVIVPNSRIGEMVVTNYSAPRTLSLVETTVWVDDAVPVEKVERAIAAGVQAMWGKAGLVPGVAPKIMVRSVTALGVEYWTRFQVDVTGWPVNNSRTLVYKSILEHLRAAGIVPSNTLQEVRYAPLVEQGAHGRPDGTAPTSDTTPAAAAAVAAMLTANGAARHELRATHPLPVGVPALDQSELIETMAWTLAMRQLATDPAFASSPVEVQAARTAALSRALTSTIRSSLSGNGAAPTAGETPPVAP